LLFLTSAVIVVLDYTVVTRAVPEYYSAPTPSMYLIFSQFFEHHFHLYLLVFPVYSAQRNIFDEDLYSPGVNVHTQCSIRTRFNFRARMTIIVLVEPGRI
jgi:hypothetical protein